MATHSRYGHRIVFPQPLAAVRHSPSSLNGARPDTPATDATDTVAVVDRPQRTVAWWIALALVAVIALAFLGWQSMHLNGASMGYDEGVYLSSGQRLAAGDVPYQTLFFSKPPLFAVELDGVGRLSGWHIGGYRLVMVLWALATLVQAAVLAWRWRGPWAAVATAGLLAISPKFVFYARPIGSDVAVTALMMLAVLASIVAIERKSRWPWAIAGGAAVAAFGMKPNGGIVAVVVAIGFIWWLVQQPSSERRPAFLRALFTIVGALVTVLIMLPFSIQQNAYKQAITYELSGRGAYPLNLAGNVREIVSFIWLDRGLVVLAAIGLVLALRRPLTLVPAMLLAWLVVNGGFLVIHTPLFSHHVPVLLPPLAIFAGSGFVTLVDRIIQSVRGLRIRRPLNRIAWVASVFSVLVLLGVVALVPHLASINRASARQTRTASEREFDAALRQFVPAGGTVVTDDQYAAFAARLPVGSWFCDTSTYRVDSGYLTGPEAIAKTEEERPAAVVFAGDKLSRLTDYVTWVQSRYDRVWSNGTRAIYVRK